MFKIFKEWQLILKNFLSEERQGHFQQIDSLLAEKEKMSQEIESLKDINKSSEKLFACYNQARENIIKDPCLSWDLTKEIHRLLDIYPKDNEYVQLIQINK